MMRVKVSAGNPTVCVGSQERAQITYIIYHQHIQYISTSSITLAWCRAVLKAEEWGMLGGIPLGSAGGVAHEPHDVLEAHLTPCRITAGGASESDWPQLTGFQAVLRNHL